MPAPAKTPAPSKSTEELSAELARLNTALEEATAGHKKELEALLGERDEAAQKLTEAVSAREALEEEAEGLAREKAVLCEEIKALKDQLAEAGTAQRHPVADLSASGKVDLDALARKILSAGNFEAAAALEGVFKLVEHERSWIVVTVDGQRQEISK